MMPRRGKKAPNDRLVKNPGFRRPHTGEEDSSDEENPPTAGQHQPQDMENEELDRLDLGIEQGEILSDGGSEHDAPQDPGQLAKMVRDLRHAHAELTTKLSEITEQQSHEDYEWKKEGLKRQNEIAQKVIKKLELALSSLELNDNPRTRALIKEAREVLKQRTKELRIADNSEAGWETVNAYRSHPVAEDSDDDKRIRKAKKLAKERMANRSKRTRFGRRGNYNRRPFNRNWQNRDDFNPQYKDPTYRSTGATRGLESGQRATYYPNRRRPSPNSLCFHCGQPGHWQDQCPVRNRRDR